jgi:hypothetical protein
MTGRTRFLLASYLAACAFLLTACPVPPQPPKPSPTPGPTKSYALRVAGNRFVDSTGKDVLLGGAIVCCADYPASGWPLIAPTAMQAIKDGNLNFTHVRTGPFTPSGEAPQFAAYVDVHGRADLTQFNEQFFQLLQDTVNVGAVNMGLYVEVDLVDRWVRGHGQSDIPYVDPWQASQNVQREQHGGLAIFASAPDPIHEAFIRKVVRTTCKTAALYNDGNEGFKGSSVAWTRAAAAIVRDELAKAGCPAIPYGTTSMDPTIEAMSEVAYASRHSQLAQPAGPKPIQVTEYPEMSGPVILTQARNAKAAGTYYHMWRGNIEDWQPVLNALGQIRTGTEPTPTFNCPKVLRESDPGWTCSQDKSLAMYFKDVDRAVGQNCGAYCGGNDPFPSQSEAFQYIAAVTKSLAAAGYCVGYDEMLGGASPQPWGEVAIFKGANWSENYQLVSTALKTRTSPGAISSTCAPALAQYVVAGPPK